MDEHNPYHSQDASKSGSRDAFAVRPLKLYLFRGSWVIILFYSLQSQTNFPLILFDSSLIFTPHFYDLLYFFTAPAAFYISIFLLGLQTDSTFKFFLVLNLLTHLLVHAFYGSQFLGYHTAELASLYTLAASLPWTIIVWRLGEFIRKRKIILRIYAFLFLCDSAVYYLSELYPITQQLYLFSVIANIFISFLGLLIFGTMGFKTGLRSSEELA